MPVWIARVAGVWCLALCVAAGCATTKADVGGLVAADGRVFFTAPKYPGQEPGQGVSLVADPKFSLKIDGDRHRLALEPFYRLDSVDDKRSHADVREASYRLSLSNWRIGIGAGIFSWGVLESYRPVDVLNQTDFVEAWDGSAKLGQPYAEIAYAGETVSFAIYYLPYFRERTFPGTKGRPRFSAVVDTDHPQFETALAQWQPSGAARLSIHKSGVDIGLSAFTGLSREPRFVLELTSLEVAPRYELLHRASLDAQWTVKALTLKLEGCFSLYSEQLIYFFGGGAGLDYSFFSFAGGADLTIALEFLFDTRNDSAPVTFFKHDAFLGVRFALNDTGNLEIIAGAIIDVIDGTVWGRGEVSRRFGEHFRVALGANLFFGQTGSIQGSFNRDHYAQMRIAYLF